jgi:hypothetical protein
MGMIFSDLAADLIALGLVGLADAINWLAALLILLAITTALVSVLQPLRR